MALPSNQGSYFVYYALYTPLSSYEVNKKELENETENR